MTGNRALTMYSSGNAKSEEKEGLIILNFAPVKTFTTSDDSVFC